MSWWGTGRILLEKGHERQRKWEGVTTPQRESEAASERGRETDRDRDTLSWWETDRILLEKGHERQEHTER